MCQALCLGVHWKDWCWSWNFSTLATSCEELTHWKRLWCWEGLGAGGKGDDRGWDGWMTSPTRWTWVSVNSGRWWWTGRSGVLWFMGLQRVRHDWATELNWTDGKPQAREYMLDLLPYSPSQVDSSGYLPKAVHYECYNNKSGKMRVKITEADPA